VRFSLSLRAVLIAATLAAACSKPPLEALHVERNLLTVDNRTDRDWLDVEIWINRQYRITAKRIAAHTRFSAALDMFVAGWGQRFDVRKQRIDSLELKAHEPGGAAVLERLGLGRRTTR
jgi:hypothetical protein